MANAVPDTATQTPNVAPASGSKQVIPFRKATFARTKQISAQGPYAYIGAGVNPQNNNVVGEGLLYSAVMDVKSFGGAGAITTPAAYFEDAPFSIIDQWSLADPSSTLVQLGGFNIYIANLMQKNYAMGYLDMAPTVTSMGEPILGFPLVAQNGSSLFHAGDAWGNFHFIMDVPIAINRRTLAGLLGNQSKSTTYVLQNNIAAGTGSATGPVFTTQPVVATNPTVTIAGQLHTYTVPPATLGGNQVQRLPANYGTLHRLSQSTNPQAPSNGGQVEHQITQLGRTVRAMALIWRDVITSGAALRNNVELAPPTTIEFQLGDSGVYKESYLSRRAEMYRQYGFHFPTGVLVYADGMSDFGNAAGAEAGNSYFKTASLSSGTITVSYPTTAGHYAAGSNLNSIVDTLDAMRAGG